MNVHRKDVVMPDLAWSFIGNTYSSRAEFERELREAQHGAPLEPGELVLLVPEVCVRYELQDDEGSQEEVTLRADDGFAFSVGELMFKLHNAVVAKLSEQDHHFFEGLRPIKGNDKPPIYSLWLGS